MREQNNSGVGVFLGDIGVKRNTPTPEIIRRHNIQY
jgi:hypothetical protein